MARMALIGQYAKARSTRLGNFQPNRTTWRSDVNESLTFKHNHISFTVWQEGSATMLGKALISVVCSIWIGSAVYAVVILM